MNQIDQLLDLFRSNGNRLTLRQILNTTLCCEYRARISEMRNKYGYDVQFSRGKKASDNLYTLVEPEQLEFNLKISAECRQ